MSKYDELVSIYLKAKDEHENNGIICQNFVHDLMKSIFRAFGCPAGIMVGDSKRDQKRFWNTSFLLMIVPNFPSSIAVKKSDGRFIVKFESDDTQFTFTDMASDNLESFYDFVFARWKEKLAHYFHCGMKDIVQLSPIEMPLTAIRYISSSSVCRRNWLLAIHVISCYSLIRGLCNHKT